MSDTFEELHAELNSEKSIGTDPEDFDEYSAFNIFRVAWEARWLHIQATPKQPKIGKVIDDAMVACPAGSFTHADTVLPVVHCPATRRTVVSETAAVRCSLSTPTSWTR